MYPVNQNLVEEKIKNVAGRILVKKITLKAFYRVNSTKQ